MCSVSLHMRADVVERRQAIVFRLLALRAAGRLHSDSVNAAAESLGVGGAERVAMAGRRRL
jgi:hypothetical protein